MTSMHKVYKWIKLNAHETISNEIVPQKNQWLFKKNNSIDLSIKKSPVHVSFLLVRNLIKNKICWIWKSDSGGRITQVDISRFKIKARWRLQRVREDLTRSLAESHPSYCPFLPRGSAILLMLSLLVQLSRWRHTFLVFLDVHIGRSQWCFFKYRWLI